MSDKTVTINLALQSSGNGAKTLEAVGDRARKAHKEVKSLADEMRRMDAASRAHAASPQARGAANQPGVPPGVAGMPPGGGLGAAAIAAAVVTAVRTATSLGDAFNNSTMGTTQKFESAAKGFGPTKMGWDLASSLTGTTDMLRRQNAIYEDAAKQVAVLARAFAEAAVVIKQAGGLGDTSRVHGLAPLVGFAGGDRSTVAGERAFQQASAMVPLEIARRRAEINSSAAYLGAGRAGIKTAEAEQEVAEAQKAFDNRKENWEQYGKNGGQGMRERAALGLQQRALELEAAQAKLTAARKAEQQSVTEAVQAESQVRKAGIAVEQQRLSILIQQENRVKNQATTFASLNEAEKSQALQIAQMAKTRGVANLTPEQRGLLSRAGGGEFVNKELEKLGAADPRFKQLKGLLGEGDEADLAKIQKERVRVENKIAIDVQIDEQKLARDMSDQVGAVLKKVVEDLREQFRIQMQKIEVERVVKNAFGG
jgi:hypothetical protein